MEPDTHAAFVAFLRSNRRSASAITRCVDHVIAFEEWLGRPLADATTSDLDRFVAEQDPPTLAKTHLWALAYYFDFVEIEELAEQSRRLRASLVRPRPLSLSTLVGVDPAVVSASMDWSMPRRPSAIGSGSQRLAP